ncbi:hypothetical protein GXW82_03435 [Streptacidiphilus sp. 4-A2]|nr:hypothetical protein [Streptacidiphilus sp. 4-A2]
MKDETSALDTHSGGFGALLQGGPAEIPSDRREQPAHAGEGRIKLPHYGGYEHFERTEERSVGYDGQPRQVYRWVTRTEIAEWAGGARGVQPRKPRS